MSQCYKYVIRVNVSIPQLYNLQRQNKFFIRPQQTILAGDMSSKLFNLINNVRIK